MGKKLGKKSYKFKGGKVKRFKSTKARDKFARISERLEGKRKK